METCDCNHLLLYAKNHYRRSGDVIQDVRVIVAERCMLHVENTSDEDVWAICHHALLEYSHQHIDQFLRELFKPQWGDEGYHVSQWFSDNCPLSRAINLVLLHLSRVKVLDSDGNKILELGEADPKILEVRSVIRCIDNSGMEGKFDQGVEYMCADHKDPKMIYVYDKLGEKQECFLTRFERLGPAKKAASV